MPPRWLGQFGYTSRITEWKPRFNYTWDWTSRLVQIGIWDAITLEAIDGAEIESLRCVTDVDPVTGLGSVRVTAAASDGAGCSVEVDIEDAADVLSANGSSSPPTRLDKSRTPAHYNPLRLECRTGSARPTWMFG